MKGIIMKKFVLTDAHRAKRAEKKHFVLRDDIMGTFLQREMTFDQIESFTL